MLDYDEHLPIISRKSRRDSDEIEGSSFGSTRDGYSSDSLKFDLFVDDIEDRFGSYSSVTLTWEDLNVSAMATYEKGAKPCSRCFGDKKDKEKIILNNVSGIVKPGQFMAIMGVSGAGKTTLLNTLFNKYGSDLIVRGSIKINGKKLGRKKSSMITAYVQQEDFFIGTLTIYEVLMFHATLRMDCRIPSSEKKAKVRKILKELGLVKIKDRLCGTHQGMIHGISGGEQKRLSIACELLKDPPLLFIDEPTSGLDSYMAKNVITIIAKLAKANRTVLCTIHQPTSDVFALFDRLYLVAEGGNAFTGTCTDALKFFAEMGKPCPVNFNPADHYVFTMAIIPGDESGCRARVQKINDKFAASQYMADMKHEIKQVEFEHETDEKVDSSTLYLAQSSVMVQIKANLTRSYYNAVRNPRYSKLRLAQYVVMGLLTGLAYFETEDTQEAIQDKRGLFFFMMTILTFNNVFLQAQSIPMELPVIKTEYRNGMYGVISYMSSRIIMEIPYLVVLTFIFWTIIYFMAGLRLDLQVYLTAYVACLAVTWVATCVGLLIASATGNVVAAVACTPICLLPFFLFGGLYQNEKGTPYYFYPIKYVSWFRYGFNMLMINEFAGVDTIDCPNTTLDSGKSVYSKCNFVDGADILNFYNVNASELWFPNFFILIITGVVLYTLSCICLYCKVRQKNQSKS